MNAIGKPSINIVTARFALFTALWLQALCGYSQLTLEDCQSKAMSNYPLIKQHELISKATEFNISNANKAYLPQISFTGFGAYIISGLPSVSLPGVEPPASDKVKFIGLGQLNQTIWDGGATRSVRSITDASAEVEKANIDV